MLRSDRNDRTLRPGRARFWKNSYDERGWLYFVQAGDRVKIGFTKRPTFRFLAAAAAAKAPVTVLACVPGTKRLEREMLEWFAPWNIFGGRHEWFEAAPDLVAYASILGGLHVGEVFGPYLTEQRKAS